MQGLSDSRPVLLIDLDGLLGLPQCEAGRLAIATPAPEALSQLPGYERELARLANTYRLLCCTAGDGEALERSGAGGLEITLIQPRELRDGWQLGAAQQALTEWRGPLAWLDQGFDDQRRDWAAARIAHGARTWLVDLGQQGLTPELADALLEWAR